MVTGAQLKALGMPKPGALRAFARTRRGWRAVPVQVDERFPLDLGRAYGREPNGVVVTSYADPSTFTGPDPKARLDPDDELAFMARDAGRRAPRGSRPRRVSRAPVEIALRDPLSGERGWVYLVAAPRAARAKARYVGYRFALVGGEYRDVYRNTSGYHPEQSLVATRHYVRGFQDRWKTDQLAVGGGGDILDRHRAQFGPGQCFPTDESMASGGGAFIANRSGPVRAIRSFMGANSGPLTQREHVFYERREEIRTYLRVHAIPGVMDVFDYSSAASGMTYRSSLAPGGVTVDGSRDQPARGETEWEQIAGARGTLTHVHAFETTFDQIRPSSYYLDAVQPGSNEATCTGDGAAYGVSGPWIDQSIPNTDPSQGPSGRFSSTRTLFYDSPQRREALARAHAAAVRAPLVVRVRE